MAKDRPANAHRYNDKLFNVGLLSLVAVLRFVLAGFVVPLLIDVLVLKSTGDGFGGWLISIPIGFVLVAWEGIRRGLSPIAVVIVGCVYCPVMFLFFLWSSTSMQFFLFRIPAF